MTVVIILLILALVLVLVNMMMTGGTIETVEQLKCVIRKHAHPGNDPEVKELFELLIYKQETIMATLAEVKQEFDTLKAAIAEERAQATAKLVELQTSIDNLTTNIQQGGTEAERDSLLNDIRTQVAEVKAIIPDPATPAEETEEEQV